MMSCRDIPERRLEPPEDKLVGYCDHCGGEIYKGGECYHIDGQTICGDCLEDFATEYFADCFDPENENYAIDGGIIEEIELGPFAQLFFAGERKERM